MIVLQTRAHVNIQNSICTHKIDHPFWIDTETEGSSKNRQKQTRTNIVKKKRQKFMRLWICEANGQTERYSVMMMMTNEERESVRESLMSYHFFVLCDVASTSSTFLLYIWYIWSRNVVAVDEMLVHTVICAHIMDGSGKIGQNE